MEADLVVIGGGVGGCAAAISAAQNGLRVIVTEETSWIGGQLTSQAVPPDENPWIETFGGTRSYLQFRRGIRDYYQRHYPLTSEARATPFLNPGNGWVSRLCHEPRVALAVLHEMMAALLSSGRIRILLRHRAVDAEVDSAHVKAVRVRNLETGNFHVLRGAFFADATELGDLLPMTKTEYVTGAESRAETGEPHAPEHGSAANQQAFTCCFAMDYLRGEDHRISRPAEYSFWRDFVPRLRPAWPGRLLSFQASEPATSRAKTFEMDPEKATGLWAYRRICDKTMFTPGTCPSDISLVNWPQNDFLLGNLCDVTEIEASRNIARAKQLSLSLLYWLQTEAPRPDGGTGWPGLRLRPDIVGTEDGLAMQPYIRESRRIRAEFTVLEQHVGTEARTKAGAPSPLRATNFSDSVGIGSYRIDLHPSTGGDNYLDISSLPFQIPLGSLIPRRIENLLPACKNIGVTHITNGCYRLHPVEWNIGESVGTLAAFAIARKTSPRSILKNPRLLRDCQARLENQGVPLSWPESIAR
ncbi:MAG TPA: FAD-dependent oxidoreductase [Verrucomicrobiae bacterium]|nr:FAD-dependent oxidoreductase [Verrucomicrobiae bacterium]